MAPSLCQCHGRALMLLEGIHKFEFDGGHLYEGEWAAGKPHGKGTLTWNKGATYEGTFVHGVMEGRGKVLHTDGSVYEGDVANNMQQGEGVLSFPAEGEDKEKPGAVFRGKFTNNNADGDGMFQYPEGPERKGVWVAGDLAYEEGADVTTLTGFSGVSAEALGGETVELNISSDLKQRRQKGSRPTIGMLAGQGEVRAEDVQLPGFSDTSGAALGEEVSLNLGLRSMKRNLRGDGELQGTGEMWHEHEEEDEESAEVSRNEGTLGVSLAEVTGEEFQLGDISFSSLKRGAKAPKLSE